MDGGLADMMGVPRLVNMLQAVTPGLAARLCYRIWVTPSYWQGPARVRGPSEEERFHIRCGGSHLVGYAWGHGPQVLLVHGWGGSVESLGRMIEPLVSSGLRVVGFDLPAHGASPGRSTDPFSVAAALGCAVRQLGDLHAVVAHSMGGIFTALALADGMGARGVVLLAPVVRPERAFQRFCSELGLNERTDMRLRSLVEERHGKGVWERASVDLVAQQFTIPTLIIHDRGDRQAPFDDAEELARRSAGAELMDTVGLGHHRILEDQVVIAKTVRFAAGLR